MNEKTYRRVQWDNGSGLGPDSQGGFEYLSKPFTESELRARMGCARKQQMSDWEALRQGGSEMLGEVYEDETGKRASLAQLFYSTVELHVACSTVL